MLGDARRRVRQEGEVGLVIVHVGANNIRDIGSWEWGGEEIQGSAWRMGQGLLALGRDIKLKYGKAKLLWSAVLPQRDGDGKRGVNEKIVGWNRWVAGVIKHQWGTIDVSRSLRLEEEREEEREKEGEEREKRVDVSLFRDAVHPTADGMVRMAMGMGVVVHSRKRQGDWGTWGGKGNGGVC